MVVVEVASPGQAVADLEQELGFGLRGFMPGTIAVPDRMKIDVRQLTKYLNHQLKLHDAGAVVRCFMYDLLVDGWFSAM